MDTHIIRQKYIESELDYSIKESVKIENIGRIVIMPRFYVNGLSESAMIQRKNAAKSKKTFRVSPKIRRDALNKSVALVEKQKTYIHFLCLTFPFMPTDKEANNYFSMFMENLKKNYNAKSYIATKEYQNNGRPHFHLLVEMPYQKYTVLNKAWNMTYRKKNIFSNNALTTRKGFNTIRKNPIKAIRYITKYMGKDIETVSENRVYFTSHDLKNEKLEINYKILQELIKKHGVFFEMKNDFCRVIYLKDYSFTKERHPILKFIPTFQ